jgi:hypothetical protein
MERENDVTKQEKIIVQSISQLKSFSKIQEKNIFFLIVFFTILPHKPR